MLAKTAPERAPLIARDVEAAGASGNGPSGGWNGVEGGARADDGTSTRVRGRWSAGGGVMVMVMCAIIGLGCALGWSGSSGVADAARGIARLGSRASEIDEGSTKNCKNADGDMAIGTFQIETSKCSDPTGVAGCVGKKSMCRFCQTHIATNRNHDWPLCPQKVCEEHDTFGCKVEGKKMTKREIAWEILRRHVIEHNKMVDGVSIGKCIGNAQDQKLGRYQYSDKQCSKMPLPGCLGSGSQICRFCNVKNAKKAESGWPTCPSVVCDKHKVKDKYCDELKKYGVPPETPPADWDGKKITDSLDLDDVDGDDDDEDEKKKNDNKKDEDDDVEEEASSHSKHHASKHNSKSKHQTEDDDDSVAKTGDAEDNDEDGEDEDEDKDEDEDEDDAAEDDDDDNAADDDAEEEDDGSDASTALLGSKEKGGEKERTKKVKHNVHHSDDDDDDDDEYYSKDDVPVENDDDIEEERDSEHTSSGHRHHHHSSVKLGESGRDEVQAKDLDDIVFNTFDSAT